MSLHFNPLVQQLPAAVIPTIGGWAAHYDGTQGPLLGLSQAVPGYPPHPLLLRALSELALDSATCGYGDIEGEPALRQAYADWVGRTYGAEVPASRVQITAGCNQAFHVVVRAIAREGDRIALVEPYYFNHHTTLQSLGLGIDTVPARAEDGFVPRADAVRAALARGVRALVLVSPNNPCGAIYPPELIADISALCRAHGAWLLLDETYRDFLPPAAGSAPPHGLLGTADHDHVVQLYSFSKSLCIPGHRLGAVLAQPALGAELAKLMDDLQICAPRLPQLAVARALAQPELHQWMAANRTEIERRAQALRAAFAQAPDWQLSSVGAYFAFVRHPLPGVPSADVARLLAERCGVLTVPGGWFGAGQEGFLRVAFANVGAEAMAQIPARLARFDAHAAEWLAAPATA